jgi:arylsulfatase A
MNMPHYPYQGDVRWLKHFQERPYPRNLYAAFVATLDERLGTLLAKVDALGLREKTIVVYQSDNGHSTEERAHFGGGSAGPFRGAKFSMLEGGIRLPAVISWPAHLPQGEVREQPSHACDWLPTLAELTGVPPPDAHLDGRSLVTVLRDADAAGPHADHALHWQIGVGPGAEWAVRAGDWKLIGRSRDTTGPQGEWNRIENWLVNLRDDPGETTNLADARPEVVARLQKLHDRHLVD